MSKELSPKEKMFQAFDAHDTKAAIAVMKEFNINVNANTSPSGKGTPALAFATRDDDLEAMDYLLSNGANRHGRDVAGFAIMHFAKSEAAVNLLVSHKVSVDAGTKGHSEYADETTALHIAAKEGDVKMVQSLLKANASVKALDQNGVSALAYAAQSSDAIYDLLAKAGAAENIRSNIGPSPKEILDARHAQEAAMRQSAAELPADRVTDLKAEVAAALAEAPAAVVEAPSVAAAPGDVPPVVADAAAVKPGVDLAAEYPELFLDQQTVERLAANRAADRETVRELIEANRIEPHIEAAKQVTPAASAWASKKVEQVVESPAPEAPRTGENKLESDEIFAANKSAVTPIVPPEIEKHYLRVGQKFYHNKNKELVAFEDKGNQLETKSDSENIAKSLVAIAQARGWDEIKVSGSETFKREVWMEAATRGMHTKGYKPSEIDLAELAKRIPENKVEKVLSQFRGGEIDAAKNAGLKSTSAPEKSAGKGGELVDHGAAPYRNDPDNKPSYFVKTKNEQGQESTAWGVDLQRAVQDSGAKIGDRVELAKGAGKPVEVVEPVRKEGKVVGQETVNAKRNEWTLRVVEAFQTKDISAAVKQHPELAGSAALLAAAEKHSGNLSPAQKVVVMARVRENVVNSIERGDMPTVNLKEKLEIKTPKVDQEKEMER